MRKLLLLKLANANFGIWENELKDVRTDLAVHNLPYNNRCIPGVARLNDRFLSIADLSYCMGYPQIQGETRTVLVMPGDKDVAGFVIDGEPESIETDEKTIIPIEKCAQSAIVDSCIHLQSKLIPIINIAVLHSAVQSADFVLSDQNLELKTSTPKKGDKKLHFVECDNHSFALQASAIENAIARPEEIAPISQLPEFAEGLIYYNQKAVPLISLTRRIGFSTEDQSSFVLPTHIEDQAICFLVSSDRGELEPNTSTEPLPPLVKSKWLESVIIHENVILPVIDSYSLLLPGADEKTEQESDQYHPTVSFEPGSNDTEVIELSLIGVKHAIPKTEVKDNLDIRSLTRIPNVSPMILGVVEHKGEIIPVLDLALCYGEVSSITPNWKMALVENSNFKAFVATDRMFDPHSLTSDLQRRLPINLANQFVYGCYTDHNSDAVILILNVPSIAIHYKSEASDSTLTIFAKEFEDSVKERKASPLKSTFELPPQPEKVAVERVVTVQKQEPPEVVETDSEEDPVAEVIEQEEDQEQVGAKVAGASEQNSAEEQPEDKEASAEEADDIAEYQEKLVEKQTEETEPAVTEEKASEDEHTDAIEATTVVAEDSESTDQIADNAFESDTAPEDTPAVQVESEETEEQDTVLAEPEESEHEATEIEEADTVPEQTDVDEDEVTELEETGSDLEDSDETTEIEEADTVPEQTDVEEGDVTELEEAGSDLEDSDETTEIEEADTVPEQTDVEEGDVTELEEAGSDLEDSDETTEIEEADTVPAQTDVEKDDVTELEEAGSDLEDSTETDTKAPELEKPEDDDKSFAETTAEDLKIEDEQSQTEKIQSEEDLVETGTDSDSEEELAEAVSDSEISDEFTDKETDETTHGELETIAVDKDEVISEDELTGNETEDSVETVETDVDQDTVEESKQNEEPETVAAFTADNVMSSPEGLDDIEYDTTIPEESSVSDELTKQEDFLEEADAETTETEDTEAEESISQEAIEATIDDQTEKDPSREVEETSIEDIQDSSDEGQDETPESSGEEKDEPVDTETKVSDESDVKAETEVSETIQKDLQEEAEADEGDAELDERSTTKPKKPDYLHVAKAIELDTPKPEHKSTRGRFFFIAAALFGLVIVFFVGPFQQQEPAIQPLSEQTGESAKQEAEPKEPVKITEESVQSQEPPSPEEVEVVVEVIAEPVIIEEKEILPPQKPVEGETETINYVVKKGDYLFRITKTYTGDGYNYPKIQEDNKIPNADLIYPDQVIKIKIKKQDESE